MRVKILATGGTIAGKGNSADRAAYTAAALAIDDLLNAVPQIQKIAEISGEQLASVGSQDMSVEIWLKLAKRIDEIFSNEEADAVIITHGTDTQEETAYFLDLTVKYNKPVILTGAMRAATAISADGPKNLLDAVAVAATPESARRGTLVVFGEKIFDGRDVVKISTTGVDAFAAPNVGPIGQVYDNKVFYYMASNRKSTLETPFNVLGLDTLPRVDIVYMYAGAPATGIEAAVAAGAKGIVIAGVGNGNFNAAFKEATEKAIQKGIKMCRASRIVSGRVTLDDEMDDDKIGTIVSDDLNPAKARILLMLSLTQTQDTKQIQQYFFEY